MQVSVAVLTSTLSAIVVTRITKTIGEAGRAIVIMDVPMKAWIVVAIEVVETAVVIEVVETAVATEVMVAAAIEATAAVVMATRATETAATNFEIIKLTTAPVFYRGCFV